MNADYRNYLGQLMTEVQPSEPRDVAQVWRAYFNEGTRGVSDRVAAGERAWIARLTGNRPSVNIRRVKVRTTVLLIAAVTAGLAAAFAASRRTTGRRLLLLRATARMGMCRL
jgi:hypothetical protein